VSLPVPNSRGFEKRDEFRALIALWARAGEILVAARPDPPEVAIGEVRFRPAAFREPVRYVWRGGWPRWENDEPPDYVEAMRAAVIAGRHWSVRGSVARFLIGAEGGEQAPGRASRQAKSVGGTSRAGGVCETSASAALSLSFASDSRSVSQQNRAAFAR